MKGNRQAVSMLSMVRLLYCLALLLRATLCCADDGQQQIASLGDFKLESGETIVDCRVGYRTFGTQNQDHSNIVVVSTWFTGRTGDMAGLVGGNKLFDTSKYYVVAIDALGNGVSSSPSNSKRQPRTNFPNFSIRDIVHSEHELLTNVLGIRHVKAVAGSSTIGGQATLQWTVSYPDFMETAIAISASPKLTAYNLLFHHALRDAITTDPVWEHGNYTVQPGTRLVAELASLIDFGPDMYNETHKREDVPATIDQMAKLIGKFDANDLLRQSEAISEHDISLQFRGSMDAAAKTVKARTLIIVSSGERIVEPGPALSFAKMVHAEVVELHNRCGQVLSECDADRVQTAVAAFLESR